MKKYLQIIMLTLIFDTSVHAQSSDFIPGDSVIFDDRFELDPKGDFPVKWSTSGDGEVVLLDNASGKWLKISQPTAVSPELKKALPENCTIEFDLFLKNTAGGAPVVKFGLTTLSDVALGDVHKRSIYVQLQGYNDEGTVVFGKNIQDLGTKSFAAGGYIGRTLHISIAINNSRFRVYFDQQKMLDMPKLLTPEYRNNFFVASATVIPASEEGVYISNVRIAAGKEDARSVLRKQLMKQEPLVASDTLFNNQTNETAKVSQPATNQQGQALQQIPVTTTQMNSSKIINSVHDSIPPAQDSIPAPLAQDNIPLIQQITIAGTVTTDSSQVIQNHGLKLMEEKIKYHISNKLNEKSDQIINDIKGKAVKAIENSNVLGKAKKLLSNLIKL